MLVTRVAGLALLAALASPVRAAPQEVAARIVEPSEELPAELLDFLEESVGYEAERDSVLLAPHSAKLRRWAPAFREARFQAPPHSYLRRLFSRPRIDYLLDLLERPVLLDGLPGYLRLKRHLGLSPAVDTDLRVALQTLRRIGRIGDEELQWIRALQEQGYRFAFPDVDLLLEAYRKSRLRRALQRPDSVRREIERRLSEREHVARETTDLREDGAALEVLSRVDWLRISLILDSLESDEAICSISSWIDRARNDSVETGGVVTRQKDQVRWRTIPSSTRTAGRYRRPEEPRFRLELAAFHLHATEEDDRPAAGPSLMDVLGAAFDGAPRLVVTDLGAGEFDVDYYRDANGLAAGAAIDTRLKPVDLDLGVYRVPPRGCPADGRASSRGREEGNR